MSTVAADELHHRLSLRGNRIKFMKIKNKPLKSIGSQKQASNSKTNSNIDAVPATTAAAACSIGKIKAPKGEVPEIHLKTLGDPALINSEQNKNFLKWFAFNLTFICFLCLSSRT